MSQVKLIGFEADLRDVWNWINKKKAGILAVTGNGGVGKTTLLKLIHDKLRSTESYNFMIWVTVSSDFQVGDVQDEIWREIGSLDEKWVEKNTQEKAKCINSVLSQNKFILFLDDIWPPIDLTSLGIPDPRHQNESIIILSSRDTTACVKMRVETFQLDGLSEEVALDLFLMKVGRHIPVPELHDNFHVAHQISNLCSGLPIYLSAVAGAMACRKTYTDWKFALEELRRDLKQGTQDQVLLKFCYDSLPSDMVKHCFLYFSLFPEDFTIPKSDLIDFWISEEFFGYYDSKDSALNVGYNIIDTLIKANLFEEENDSVKMLDMIRDFAFNLVWESNMFNGAQLVAWGDGSASSVEKLGVGKISSLKNIIQHIPSITPHLSIFFIQRNPFIMIKHEYMFGLTVLDLSYTSIEVVPRQIAELNSLQHLNLSHTYIERLPVELKKLKKLTCLNLENDDQLRLIPKGVLSSMSSLQVVRMFRCGFSLQEEDDNILSATSMDISELHCLKSLKLLSITITCASALKDFFSNQLLLNSTHALSLQVFWGSKSLDISSIAAMEHLLTLEIDHAEQLRDIYVNSAMHITFASLREVNVGKCSNLQNLSGLILAPNLAILRVSYCPEIEEIISIEQMGEIENADKIPFAKLEVLELENLSKLKSIYSKALPFEFLKKIQVSECPLLKKLPLNAKSARGTKLDIIAEEEWWKQVEWEDGATEDEFRVCFKLHPVERKWYHQVGIVRSSPPPRRSYFVRPQYGVSFVERSQSDGRSYFVRPQYGVSFDERSQSDGRRGSQQGFKQYFCGCLGQLKGLKLSLNG